MALGLLVLLSMAITTVYSQFRATYHDYEDDRQRLGKTYDNSPGWCGIRYSVLNVARITAVHGMNAGLCNQCLEVQNVNGGPLVYVLAVDWKEDPGLDIAKSSFAAITPGANPLDPQTVNYRVVNPSFCAGICQGTADECTPGRRNLLPAHLLPSNPTVQASFSGSSSNTQAEAGGAKAPEPESSPKVEAKRTSEQPKEPEKPSVAVTTLAEAGGGKAPASKTPETETKTSEVPTRPIKPTPVITVIPKPSNPTYDCQRSECKEKTKEEHPKSRESVKYTTTTSVEYTSQPLPTVTSYTASETVLETNTPQSVVEPTHREHVVGSVPYFIGVSSHSSKTHPLFLLLFFVFIV